LLDHCFELLRRAVQHDFRLPLASKRIPIMNRIVAVVFSVIVVAGATAAYGQERNPQVPGAAQVTGIGPAGAGPQEGERQSRLLFTFGGTNVRIWAPVERHYNAKANRNLAKQTIWGAG
jgi:hypothetical protein